MLTIVDRANGAIIHKVTTKNGKLVRYQTMPEGTFDASQAKFFSNLRDARESIGHKIVATVNLTKPKLEYAQNQPGYRASAKGK